MNYSVFIAMKQYILQIMMGENRIEDLECVLVTISEHNHAEFTQFTNSQKLSNNKHELVQWGKHERKYNKTSEAILNEKQKNHSAKYKLHCLKLKGKNTCKNSTKYIISTNLIPLEVAKLFAAPDLIPLTGFPKEEPDNRFLLLIFDSLLAIINEDFFFSIKSQNHCIFLTYAWGNSMSIDPVGVTSESSDFHWYQ